MNAASGATDWVLGIYIATGIFVTVGGFGLVAWALLEYTKPYHLRRSWPWSEPHGGRRRRRRH